MTNRPLLLFAVLIVAAIAVAAQPADIALRIDSPPPDTFLSGPLVLKAGIEPASAASSVKLVTFFADGKQVCRVEEPPFECNWDAGEVVRPHQIRVVASLATGRRIVQNMRSKETLFVDAVEVDVVQVTATVVDGRGRFVPGLGRNSFRVYEDGVPQKVTYFAAEDIPLEIVTAIDVSSSMRAAMPMMKQAVKKFLGSIGPADQVTLLAFNDNVFTLARRETNQTARVRAIDRLSPFGGTAIFDSILKGLELLGRQPGRRVLVVFTDGDDEASHSNMDAVQRRVEASDAALYLIGLGRAGKSLDLKGVLDRLARVSGGRVFYPDSIKQLDETFNEILGELAGQYLLAYPPSNDKKDGTWRRISVELVGAQHRVRARQGYRAISRTQTAAR